MQWGITRLLRGDSQCTDSLYGGAGALVGANIFVSTARLDVGSITVLSSGVVELRRRNLELFRA